MFFFRRRPQPGPPYRPDFYVRENMIGYTGELHNAPTIYFKSATEYGHITQAHKLASNVGREMIGMLTISDGRRRFDYTLRNTRMKLRKGGPIEEHAIEQYIEATSGAYINIHLSRNKFVDIKRKNVKAVDMMAQAIWRHPSLKRRFAG